MRDPASCAELFGKADYYQARHDDFVVRHDDLRPPDYYLGYGRKYFLRFHELREKLSQAGKDWVDRTAKILQKLIEDARDEDLFGFDALECDPDAFKHFAYGTHPQAYLDGGIADLPPTDILKVAQAPDTEDLLTHDGLAQVVRTAMEVLREKTPVEVAVVTDAIERRASGEFQVAKSGIIQVVEAGKHETSTLVSKLRLFARHAWEMHQRWDSPLFLSWRVAPQELRRLNLVPPELELDLEDGTAWISLVPLLMKDVGLSKPPLPRLAPFPEVNFRTYVRHKGVSGVYFLGLECGQAMVDLGARLFFKLPYNPAAVSIDREGEWFHCESKRADDDPSARLRVRYRPRGKARPVEDGSLEHFLVERYTMFVVDPDTRVVRRGDVRHEPWRVHQKVDLSLLETTIPAAVGLRLAAEPDHVGFSPGIDTQTFPFYVVR
jgi:uncharacterized protein YqjF (DUF2071 family)